MLLSLTIFSSWPGNVSMNCVYIDTLFGTLVVIKRYPFVRYYFLGNSFDWRSQIATSNLVFGMGLLGALLTIVT